MPDVSTYYAILGHTFRGTWLYGRAQCFECEGMFTINKNISYRGSAHDENLVCDPCWVAMGNPSRSKIRRRIKAKRKKSKT